MAFKDLMVSFDVYDAMWNSLGCATASKLVYREDRKDVEFFSL
jgi:hypothetical protein